MSTAAKLLEQQKTWLPATGPVPNRRILVVDDEKAIGEAIRTILCPTPSNVVAMPRSSRTASAPTSALPQQATPFEVVVVNTPKAALAAIQKSIQEQKPFAMGFFDVMLGADIDGIELVRQIRELDPYIFSVFATAYQDRSVDTIGAYLGQDNSEFWDYINKPFSDGEILQKARNMTSLWDLHRLKEWQEERLAEATRMLLQNDRQNTVAAIGRGMAHEFGNLLTHIVGHAELALLKKDSARMEDALNIILKAGETAKNILGRYMNFNTGAQTKGEMKAVNLLQPIEESLELMNFQFLRHRITVDKSGLKPLLVEANKHSLVQVFMNILINALHAMPEGGEITVATFEDSADQVRITVRDTGHGIPDSILSKVVEPLFTTKGSKGSGLGLAITKELIEFEHHGRFAIENHPQGGVIVTIRLPVKQEVSHV